MSPITSGSAEGLRSLAPLPPLALATTQPPVSDTRLPVAGCYLLNYVPSDADHFILDGTLRIEASSGRLRASGDLYERTLSESGEFPPPPDPAAGIPSFPMDNYRFYLGVTQITESDEGFCLAFEVRWFHKDGITLFDGHSTQWPTDGIFTAHLRAEPDAAGYPSPERCYGGEVKNALGTTVGRLTMGWVSPYLRKATIEIDRVPDSEVPLSNGMGVTWKTIFDGVGWDVTVAVSDSDVPEPFGSGSGAWTKAEANAALHAWRDKSDLDAEWRYHILAVRQIDFLGGERGVMYDEIVGWPNRLAREGLMVASHWEFPNENRWGLVKGMRTGSTVTYFRTAVHELGHAMGLDHNETGDHFMAPTGAIATHSEGTPATPFPTNIQWSFTSEDEHCLRHWPDPIVRPGGMNAHAGRSAPIEGVEVGESATP